MLDPEVWEHSSDYKPPPASHATTISNSALRTVSIAVTASLTPVASPVADEVSAFPVLPRLTAAEWLAEADAEAVAAAAARHNAMAPTIPAPAVGGASACPLQRCWAYVPPRASAPVYVRLDLERRDVYIYPAEEDEEPADDWLTVADLPATVTESRLLEIHRLEERAEEMEERFDYARSYMPDAHDPDDYGPGLSAKEYRRLEAEYEAALAEQADIYSTYGKEADEAKAAYEAAKAALVLDLFGPDRGASTA